MVVWADKTSLFGSLQAKDPEKGIFTREALEEIRPWDVWRGGIQKEQLPIHWEKIGKLAWTNSITLSNKWKYILRPNRKPWNTDVSWSLKAKDLLKIAIRHIWFLFWSVFGLAILILPTKYFHTLHRESIPCPLTMLVRSQGLWTTHEGLPWLCRLLQEEIGCNEVWSILFCGLTKNSGV